MTSFTTDLHGNGAPGAAASDSFVALRRHSGRMLGSTALCSLAGLAMLSIAAPAAAQTLAPNLTCGTDLICSLDARGAAGNSPPVNEHGPGADAGPGTPGTDTTVTTIGSVNWRSTNPGASPTLSVDTSGGAGGIGGEASVNGTNRFDGGRGGDGKDAGQMTVTVGASSTITNGGSGSVVHVIANGGAGGAGGYEANYGKAGDAGAAGDANMLTFTLSDGATLAGSANGVGAVVLDAIGGRGGDGGLGTHKDFKAEAPAGTAGGAGGSIKAYIHGTVVSAGSAILANAEGGDGGTGGDAGAVVGNASGGPGGAGGNGGQVEVNLYGASLTAVGASGAGTGPQVDVDSNDAGDTVKATLSVMSGAVVATSLGGSGGQGSAADGIDSFGGNGGNAGSADLAYISADGGKVSSTGYGAMGLVALSRGLNGGTGGSAGAVFNRKGGAGGLGGDGGAAQVSIANGTIITTNGRYGDGALALSIGGGGGIGGDISGGGFQLSIALGGYGGSGGDGSVAFATNGAYDQTSSTTWDYIAGGVISTTGDNARGVVATSVGGGGGRGGDTVNAVLGDSSYTIGANGGAGGAGGAVQLQNTGVVQTDGNHSVGLDAASIGGGGGTGGSANSYDVSVGFSVNVGVGGKGGTCTPTQCPTGGTVDLMNYGQVLTLGADSHGIQAQSIGGGGGAGGASVTHTLSVLPPTEEPIPAFNLNVSLGGNGGVGGDAGAVKVLNAGMTITQGIGSSGILAQSIGGGGGNGGDSEATTQSLAPKGIDITMAFGGKGGSAGSGEAVTVANSGLVWTLNQQSPGIQAQSLGGGGGSGGFGEASSGSYMKSEGGKLTLDLAFGGRGGSSGTGGTVTVNNFVDANSTDSFGNGASPNAYGAGGIITLGNSSDGIYAHSVGGGGGNGGNAMADGGGGTVSLSLHFGGSGGGGGDGGAVSVDNGMGTIQTYGGNSAGIFAQSVGGGGGRGGTGADNGEADPNPNFTADTLMQQGLGIGGNVTNVIDKVYAWGGKIADEFNQPSTLSDMVNNYIDNSKPEEIEESAESESTFTLDLGAGFDGNGGAAGNGGTVFVGNQSEIDTHGPLSPGIYAQSIGGGGGHAGATSSSVDVETANTSTIDASFTVGGRGGKSGFGGDVTVQAVSNTSLISTEGDVSPGILAQSVGGGGGNGAVTMVGAGKPNANGLVATSNIGAVDLGMDAWDNLYGGKVDVQAEFVRTLGDDSSGILAQSVGGGGGISVVMSANYNPATGGWLSQTGNPDPSKSVNWGFSGMAPANSHGGDVTVTLAANGGITTQGRNAYGIFAQSIGDAGGIVISDYWLPNASNGGFTGENGHNNYAGAVSVTTEKDSSITTSGAGAVGILAQSIAGGGMIGGMDGAQLRIAYQGGASHSMPGSVHVTSNGNITTTGAFAHGIFAQTGARAGVIGATSATPSGFLFTGSSNVSCGNACGDSGLVQVDVPNNTIHVSGANAYGVVMISQSGGAGTGNVALHVGTSGYVHADGASLGAVFLGGATSNSVVIDQGGRVDGYSSSKGLAFRSWDQDLAGQQSGLVQAEITVKGYVGGGALLGNGSTIDISATGTMATSDTVNLGTDGVVTNGGMFEIGPVGYANTTTLTGLFTQIAGGTLLLDVSFANGLADRMDLATGSATIAGTIASNLISVQPGYLVVMTTPNGTITLDKAIQWTSTSAFDFLPVLSEDKKSLAIQPTAQFAKVEGGLNRGQSQVAGHLQEIWDGGNQIGKSGFTALAKINDKAVYNRAMDTLTGQAVGAIAAARFASSFGFVSNMQSCPQFEEAGMAQHERACAWLRGMAGTATQDARDGSYGYQVNGETMQAGMQLEVASDWFLGVSGAYEESRFYGDAGTARITGDSVMFGLSLKRQAGDWLFSGAIDGGVGNYKSVRQIEVGDAKDSANASPKSWHVGGTLRVSRQFEFDHFYLRPSAELRVVHVGAEGYKETGSSDFNLHVASASNTTFVGTGGLEMGTQMDIGHSSRLGFFGGAGLSLLSDDRWDATARFVGAPTASVGFTASTPLPNVLGRFTAGASLYTANNIELRFQYSAEVGKDFNGQSGMARLAIKF